MPFVVSLGRRTADLSASNHDGPWTSLSLSMGLRANGGKRIFETKGSDVRMRDRANSSHKPLSVPDHKEVKAGLFRKLLRDANLNVEEFLRLLKESKENNEGI